MTVWGYETQYLFCCETGHLHCPNIYSAVRLDIYTAHNIYTAVRLDIYTAPNICTALRLDIYNCYETGQLHCPNIYIVVRLNIYTALSFTLLWDWAFTLPWAWHLLCHETEHLHIYTAVRLNINLHCHETEHFLWFWCKYLTFTEVNVEKFRNAKTPAVLMKDFSCVHFTHAFTP